jgi:hypothetical protein
VTAVVSTPATTDTARAAPFEPVIVTVTDANGSPVPGVPVHFSVRIGAGQTNVVIGKQALDRPQEIVRDDTTDVTGRVFLSVAFGIRAGSTWLQYAVPAAAISDSVLFTILPGRPATLSLAFNDTALVRGNSLPLGISFVDASGNRSSEPFAVSVRGSALALSADQTTVSGTAFGVGWVRVTGGGLYDSASVSVVPSGRLAAVWTPEFSTESYQAFAINTDLTNRQPLQVPAMARLRQPRWTAAADIVIAASVGPFTNNQLALYQVSTNVAAIKLPIDDAGVVDVSYVDVSADGTLLYFVGRRTAQFQTVRALWRSQLDGRNVVRVTAQDDIGFDRLSVSPDGKSAVGLRQISGVDFEVHVVDLAAGSSRVIAIGRAPSWSPTGDWIVFKDEIGAIKAIRPDGTGLRAIGDQRGGYEDDTIGWSSDGAWIALRRFSNLELVQFSSGLAIPIPNTMGMFNVGWRR